jgi:hypothetical protein
MLVDVEKVVDALVATRLVVVALVNNVLAKVVNPVTFNVPDELSPVVEALVSTVCPVTVRAVADAVVRVD